MRYHVPKRMRKYFTLCARFRSKGRSRVSHASCNRVQHRKSNFNENSQPLRHECACALDAAAPHGGVVPAIHYAPARTHSQQNSIAIAAYGARCGLEETTPRSLTRRWALGSNEEKLSSYQHQENTLAGKSGRHALGCAADR